jgi:hypothetical protein
MMKHEHRFTELVERYNHFIEPLENWATADIVALIEVLDCELQQRVPDLAPQEYTQHVQDYQDWTEKHFGLAGSHDPTEAA